MAKGKRLAGERWEFVRARGVYNELQLRKKGVAMETERVGIPMQPIPRQSRRARGLEASRERRLEHWWEKTRKKPKSKQNASKQRGNVYGTDDSTKPDQMAVELKRVEQCH